MACLVVDSRAGLTEQVREILGKLAGGRVPLWLVLNKIDLIPRERLLPLAGGDHRPRPHSRDLHGQRRDGDGVERLLDKLAEAMPEGPHLFPDDVLSDLPERMLAAEIVREQILRLTHEEVPHHATVETESWQERPDGSVRVECTIYVSRPGQKAIVIGEGGSKIKEIGRRARAELTASARPAGASVPHRQGPAGLG